MNKLEPASKIGRQDAINGSAKGRNKPVAGKPASAKNIDRLTLSETSKTPPSASEVKSVASEIRHALVNTLRNILQQGSYEVKADEIADKIVQKIRENKNHMVL